MDDLAVFDAQISFSMLLHGCENERTFRKNQPISLIFRMGISPSSGQPL
jgi:hypothetical protein